MWHKVYLAPHPFAALDAITRADLQQMLLALMKAQETTCLFVTHDINEAAVLGSQIDIMRDGSIVQEIDACRFGDSADKSALKNYILTQLNPKESS